MRQPVWLELGALGERCGPELTVVGQVVNCVVGLLAARFSCADVGVRRNPVNTTPHNPI